MTIIKERKLSSGDVRVGMAMRLGFITPFQIAEDLGYALASVDVSIWRLKQIYPGRVVGMRNIGYRFISQQELDKK